MIGGAIRILAPAVASAASATILAGPLAVILRAPRADGRAEVLIAVIILGLLMVYAEIAAPLARHLAPGVPMPGFAGFWVVGCVAAIAALVSPVWPPLVIIIVLPLLLPRRAHGATTSP